MIDTISKLFDRDIERLRAEIEAYQDENLLWAVRGEISNSTGNLCLHLLGNINHFIGVGYGNTDYIRNRPLEFSDKDVPKSVLLEKIDATRAMLQEVLPRITSETLTHPHTAEFQGGQNINEYFLIHLYGHLNYHLGQINYHRRLILN